MVDDIWVWGCGYFRILVIYKIIYLSVLFLIKKVSM